MKTCPRCKTSKDLSEFNKASNRPRGVQTYCKECQRDIDKAFYDKSLERRESMKQRMKKAKEDLRVYLDLQKQGRECSVCGERDPRVLEFHHIKDKLFSIGNAVSRGYSISTVAKEIRKCELLCSNCHIKRHGIRRGEG